METRGRHLACLMLSVAYTESHRVHSTWWRLHRIPEVMWTTELTSLISITVQFQPREHLSKSLKIDQQKNLIRIWTKSEMPSLLEQWLLPVNSSVTNTTNTLFSSEEVFWYELGTGFSSMAERCTGDVPNLLCLQRSSGVQEPQNSSIGTL